MSNSTVYCIEEIKGQVNFEKLKKTNSEFYTLLSLSGLTR